MLCYVEKEAESGDVRCPRAEAELTLMLWGYRLWRDEIPEPLGQGLMLVQSILPKTGLAVRTGTGLLSLAGMGCSGVSSLGRLGPRQHVGAQGCAASSACWQSCGAVPAMGIRLCEPYGLCPPATVPVAVLVVPSRTWVSDRSAAAVALWLL